jgi:A/G-specific adenine glycosylase
VYEATIERYPTVRELAAAEREEIYSLLYPLGLSWRADNVVAMARVAVARFGGEVPSARDQLMELPGVGDYVASAVWCFANDEAVPIIDTNVVRVVGRVFGLRLNGEARRRKEMRDAVEACLDRSQPRFYNYALLDFAAVVCKSTAPLCSNCPLGKREVCEAQVTEKQGNKGIGSSKRKSNAAKGPMSNR